MTVEQYDILIEEAWQHRKKIWKQLEEIQQELDDLTKELDLSMNELAYLKTMRDHTIEMGEDDEQ